MNDNENIDLQNIPPEIISQGKQAIKQYFEQLKKGETVKLYEAKVMLVGYGAVGKTSLLKRMLYNEFDEHEKMTLGINIHQWKFG